MSKHDYLRGFFQHLLNLSLLLRSVACLFVMLMVSCAHPGTLGERQERAKRLSHDLQKLASTVRKEEADRMAVTAVEESAKLSKIYKPMRLAWSNNALVNMGLRERGLCYQWRDDLFPHLFHLQCKTLQLHLATSKRGTPLEHSALVVTARGQPFNEGVLLDPWRKGGRLYWKYLADGKKNVWQPLHRDLTPMVLRPLLMPEHYP